MKAYDMPPVTVEQVLVRWTFEAWMATARVPRKRQLRAFIVQMLEIARADVATTRIDPNKSPTQLAQAAASRRAALAILEAYAPGYLARLPPE